MTIHQNDFDAMQSGWESTRPDMHGVAEATRAIVLAATAAEPSLAMKIILAIKSRDPVRRPSLALQLVRAMKHRAD